MINPYIASLVQYGLNTGMIEECDKTYITNAILETLRMHEYVEAVPPGNAFGRNSEGAASVRRRKGYLCR